MPCNICNHHQRREIEDYILAVDTPGFQMSLNDVAVQFGVSLQDLQVHALMHTPLIRLEEIPEEEADNNITSIAASLKKQEAGILYAVAEEYFHTFKQTGKEIRQRLAPARDMTDPDAAIKKMLPKEMVDLYIGAGNNIRQTVNSIVDMNQKVNGESDPALDALKSLVTAVAGGRKEDPEDD